jgi:hypothetical protein
LNALTPLRAAITTRGEVFQEHALAPAQRQDARKKAFQRCVERALTSSLIKLRECPGRPPMVWFIAPDTTAEPGETER